MSAQEKVYGKLAVRTFPDRESMGRAAAVHVAGLVRSTLEIKETANMIFAAAPSQNEFLAHLVQSRDIDWSRIVGFHMDEYIGLPPTADQFFGLYLHRHVFSHVTLRKVHLLDSQCADPRMECERYATILRENPPDIVCLGVGENGHVAFNDPPVADFHDKQLVKIAALDEPCRRQQVNDGCFTSIEEVPLMALTLTVPALTSARHLSIVVPSERKAKAMHDALTGEITTLVPASIIRTHSSAVLFLDDAAASQLP